MSGASPAEPPCPTRVSDAIPVRVSRTVHILHASSDAKIAEAIHDALLPRGHELHTIARDPAPDSSPAGVRPGGVRPGDCVILLFSRATAVSGAIGLDLVQAQRESIPVITLRLDDHPPAPAFDALLGDAPAIDLFAGWNQGIGALILALRALDAAGYRAGTAVIPQDSAFETAAPGFQGTFQRDVQPNLERKRRRTPRHLRLHRLLRPYYARIVLAALVLAIPAVLATRLGLFDPPPLPGAPLSTALLQQPAHAVLEVALKGDAAYDRGNYAEALRWYRIAAGGNDPGAQTNLGRLYAYGQGVPRDDAQALVWYRTAAIQGFPRAMNNIGAMYALGRGTSQDFGEALRWFHQAADRGSPHAAYNIGIAYETGGGVTQNFTEAHDWYNRAADRGYGPAFSALGALIEYGRGSKPDINQALRLYIDGAERHDITAMLALGRLYAGVEGIEPNLDQSLYWYRKAAEDGNPLALFLTGTIDAQAENDPDRANAGRLYIRRAADAGHQPARDWMAEHP